MLFPAFCIEILEAPSRKGVARRQRNMSKSGSQPGKVKGLGEVPSLREPVHLAIGMFDGLHLGHQSVVGAAVHASRGSGGIAAALTFWPHPSQLFRPDQAVPQITGPDVKVRLLEEAGVELVIEQPFDERFAAIPAEDFVRHLKEYLPSLAAIYVGENWRFGKGRRGDINLLVTLAAEAGIGLVSCPRLQRDGQPVSSTRIREALVRGDMAEANELLGYSYFAEGKVKDGRRLGRKIGFPTLNLDWEPELKPRFGVYVVRVRGERGKTYAGVANYGIRPTVEARGDAAPLLEVHLLTESCPLGSGDYLKVEWQEFLRPEMAFPGIAELKAQISADVARAVAALR